MDTAVRAPKTADLADAEMLAAVGRYTTIGAPYPTETFLLRFPKNLVAAKLAKLRKRGLVDAHSRLTKLGRKALDEFEAQ